MESKHQLVAIGVVMLAVLEAAAMLTGNDGVYFLPVVSAISALVALVVGKQVGVNQCMAILDELPEPVRTRVLERLPAIVAKKEKDLGLAKRK